ESRWLNGSLHGRSLVIRDRSHWRVRASGGFLLLVLLWEYSSPRYLREMCQLSLRYEGDRFPHTRFLLPKLSSGRKFPNGSRVQSRGSGHVRLASHPDFGMHQLPTSTLDHF